MKKKDNSFAALRKKVYGTKRVLVKDAFAELRAKYPEGAYVYPGMDDKINHPAHYNQGRIEVIDAIEDWRLGYHLGNVVKYVARAAHKGHELQDLEKAAWYLARKIKSLKKAS